MQDELVEYLRELVALLGEYPVSGITLRWGDSRITLERASQQVSSPGAGMPESVEAVSYRGEAVTAQPDGAVQAVSPAPLGEVIRAHLVGLFHSHAPEGDSPLVQVESTVQAGSVVGFVESMRVMNEVICPLDGQILEIYVEDGEPVEFGQELMRIATPAEPEEFVGG